MTSTDFVLLVNTWKPTDDLYSAYDYNNVAEFKVKSCFRSNVKPEVYK